tara:strand:- start:25 stop:210 length:186 start_codon:yes stop_codon:yes gene_type:complete
MKLVLWTQTTDLVAQILCLMQILMAFQMKQILAQIHLEIKTLMQMAVHNPNSTVMKMESQI